MVHASAKQWFFSLLLSALVLSIPTWSYATSFTFSTPVVGGGTFFGSFTVLPDPPDPLNFTASISGSTGPLTISALTMSTSMFPPSFNFTLSNLTPGVTGVVDIGSGSINLLSVFNPSGQRFQIAGGNPLTVTDATGASQTRGIPGGGITPTVTPNPTIPEPTTVLLLVTGLLVLAGYRWLQRRREGVQVG